MGSQEGTDIQTTLPGESEKNTPIIINDQRRSVVSSVHKACDSHSSVFFQFVDKETELQDVLGPNPCSLEPIKYSPFSFFSTSFCEEPPLL